MSKHVSCRAVALLALTVVLLGGPAAARAAERPFTKRFGVTAQGDIRIVGNTLHDCPDAAPTCANARLGNNSGSDANLWNNSYEMIQVDVDADASTFNSSRATIDLPAGASVKFAGLYWGATTAGDVGAPSPSARGTAKVDPPGAGGYQAVTATAVDDLSSVVDPNEHYWAVANVTALVAAAGEGQYTVADVQASVGDNTQAGWALVVAFEAPTEPLRNLTFFDGALVLSDETDAQTVSGFRTPLTGPVRTRVGLVGYEGEAGVVAAGDSVTLDGTAIGDAQNPTNNAFNSSVAELGTRFSAKTPDLVNQFGSLDADLIQADGLLANGATSAQVGFVAGNVDGIYPHALTFATEVQEPLLTLTKSVSDVNGGSVQAGDVLEYTLTATNDGNDAAEEVTITDAPPAGTAYVPGSIVVANQPVTDTSGDDDGEFVGSTVIGRVPTLGVGQTGTVRFRVRITPSAAAGTQIPNVGGVAYEVPDSSLSRSTTSNSAAVTVAATPPTPPLPKPTPAQCSDGIDNDNDGAIDRSDPGCLTSSDTFNPADANEGDENARQLVLCGSSAIKLVRADAKGRKVALSGFVASRFAGRKVTLRVRLRGKSKKLKTVKAKADGSFKATVRGPPKRLFTKARYQAVVAGKRSIQLKLPQSLASSSLKQQGNALVLRGKVKRSVLGKRNPVIVRRLVCGKTQIAGQAKPTRSGAYVVRFPAPAQADAALYRAEAKVLARPGSKRYVRQSARAIGVSVGGER